MTPLVSILIPAYNAQKYIAQTIQSVLNQTWKEIEIIIVDDGSTDQTFDIAKSFENNQIKVVKQLNGGAAKARNQAWHLSQGEYIKFLDADDLLSPEHLSLQIENIKNRTDVIASCQWGRFYQDDVKTFQLSPQDVWRDMNTIDWWIASCQNAAPMMQPGIFLIPRVIINRAGGWDERLSLIDDFEFFTRILLKACEIKFTNKAILYYRSGIVGGSLSRMKTRKAAESAFLSLSLATQYVLNINNTPASRLASANMFQDFIYTFYPQYPDLIKQALLKINALGGSSFNMPAGGKTKFLMKVLGWKLTKRLQFCFSNKGRSLCTLQ